MSFFEKHFNTEFDFLRPRPNKFETLFVGDDTHLLVAGDFSGIQKFIFEGLSTKNASKVLRAKSAYIQIMTRVAAHMVCDALKIDKAQILSSNAGKFELLSPNHDIEAIAGVQKKLDDFFIGHYYGLSGITLVSAECTAQDFNDPQKYKLLRDTLGRRADEKKYRKFNLTDTPALMAYDHEITNQTLCRICNIRKTANERCAVCDTFVKLGEKLVRADIISIVKGEGEIMLTGGYAVSFRAVKDAVEIFDISKQPSGAYPSWALSSYVHSENGAVTTFEELADKSCGGDSEKGVKAMAVLKADVDGMGNFIRDTDVTDSYANFDIFSKSIDAFFSVYVPALMREKYPHSYTVFAGGDDLFLIGAWNEVIDLAREIETEFSRFVKGALSISMGIIIVKPSTPIGYLAESGEAALEASKARAGKNGITLFGETVGFKTYRKAKALYMALKDADENMMELPTAFMYRLLELLRMRQELDDPQKQEEFMVNSMWKSKLSYSFRRNVLDVIAPEKKAIAEQLLGMLNKQIEHHPKETRMVLSEFIYKRRKTA